MSSSETPPPSSKRAAIVLGLLVAGLIAGLLLARNFTSPVDETHLRLEAARTAILSYAQDKGEAPVDLEALVTGGYLDTVPEDRMGNPLVYTHLDGGLYELKSLGPDGKEGGLMFKRDHSIEFEIPKR